MKAITSVSHSFQEKLYPGIKIVATAIDKWIQKQESAWENNRLGIIAAGIFIQVSFAGAMIATVGFTGGSLWVASFGILLTFLANSVAFGETPMRWVLRFFSGSIIVNTGITVYYLIQLL